VIVDLRDYARILRSRWRLVAGTTIVMACAALVFSLVQKPVYAAHIKMFVSAQESSDSGGDSSDAYQAGLLSQQRVTSYADLVSGRNVAAAVVKDLGLGLSPDAVQPKISATSPPNTVIIKVAVHDGSPERAQAIANSVGRQFAQLVDELERPASGGRAVVKVSVVEPAGLPRGPVAPRKRLNFALGLVVGLGLGAATAVVREVLDTTVKGSDDLSGLVDAPTLGVIGFDSDATRRPLIVQADPHSQRAEAFRQLRTNLQFVDIDHAPRSIVVTSSIPAEGKSTTCANLAISLAQAGVKVILVEADLRRPQISEYLGIESAVGLTSVLIGRVALEDAIQPWGGDGLLFVLPGGPIPPNPAELLGSHGMAELVKRLEASADIVLIDTPPLLPVTDAAVVAALTDGAILVAASGKTKREQVKLAASSLSKVGARLLGVVLTMVQGRTGDASAYNYEYRYAGRTGAGAPRDVVPEGSRRMKGTQGPVTPAQLGIARNAGQLAPDATYRAAATGQQSNVQVAPSEDAPTNRPHSAAAAAPANGAPPPPPRPPQNGAVAAPVHQDGADLFGQPRHDEERRGH
jgi:non-specific protein-tyrosine kinase